MSNELSPRLVLEHARALIADPSHWGKGDLLIGFHRERAEPYDALPDGGKVCVIGAIECALPVSLGDPLTFELGEDAERVRLAAMRYICRAINGHNGTIAGIPFWNDATERTHEEVLDVLDRAIQLALIDEKEGALVSPPTSGDVNEIIGLLISEASRMAEDKPILAAVVVPSDLVLEPEPAYA